MNKFERKPKEEKDPVAVMEELKYGRFSMTDEEREQITKKAIDEKKDPKEAIREYEERMVQATGRLRKEQSEEAIKELERDMNKRFSDKKKVEESE
ncbi:MAG: hypothetical protein Q7R61_00800 [bacterium]|nr:hypothetical protein [bacterium]